MKTLLTALCIIHVVASAFIEAPVPSEYHEKVGIPLATRLRQKELASDFDGSRIFGGGAAPLGAYPHMAGLVVKFPSSTSACGAALISHTRALTAAHCWQIGSSHQATSFTVVLGSTRLFYGGVRLETDNVITHEAFNMTLENDIAIIIIPWVEFNNVIQAINLHTGSSDLSGVWATVAGFGITGAGNSLTANQYLKHLTVPVITNEECRATHGSYVYNSTICTGSGLNRGNICNSDSGGPLSLGSGSNGLLIGIVSFGSFNCESGQPFGYARISYYAPWIRARM